MTDTSSARLGWLTAAAVALSLGFGCRTTGAEATATPIASQVVDVACGECQFGMQGDDCDLAVRIGDQAWFVDGAAIDDFGDAHAADGFCNAVRKARVSGTVKGGRLQVTRFELLEAGER